MKLDQDRHTLQTSHTMKASVCCQRKKPTYSTQLLLIHIGCQILCCVLLGFGVFTTEHISAGDFVLEYAGQLLPIAEADKRQNQTYIYYFELGSVTYRQAVILCKAFRNIYRGTKVKTRSSRRETAL